MVGRLLRNKIQQGRNLTRKLTAGQKVVAILFQSIIVWFALFLFALFYFVFKALKADSAGLGVIVYLLEQMFFLIFVLAIVSGAISGLYLIFRNREIPFLATMPLQPSIIFNYLLIQNTVINSWPVLVIGLPLTLGYAAAMKLSLLSTVLMLAAVIPLTVIAEFCGVLAAMVFSRFYRVFRTRAAAVLTLGAGAYFAYFLADALTPTRLSKMMIGPIKGGDLIYIQNSRISQEWLPNYWIARIFRLALTSGYAKMLIYLGTLTLISIVIGFIVVRLGGMFHLRLWKLTLETTAKPAAGRRPFPRLLSGLKGALIERDYLVFTRNSSEVYQAFFIFLLVLLFVFIVSKIPFINQAPAVWRYRLVLILFGAICYLMAMAANRFIFPTLSLEGRNFWILLSSPLDLRQIYWAKLISSMTVLTLLGTALLLISSHFYRISAVLTAIMIVWVIAAGIAVTSISLGIGILYPNFSNRSAAELSSTMPGLLSTIGALVYGGLGMWLLSPVIAGYYLGEAPAIVAPTVVYLTLSLALFIYMSALSTRKLSAFRL